MAKPSKGKKKPAPTTPRVQLVTGGSTASAVDSPWARFRGYWSASDGALVLVVLGIVFQMFGPLDRSWGLYAWPAAGLMVLKTVVRRLWPEQHRRWAWAPTVLLLGIALGVLGEGFRRPGPKLVYDRERPVLSGQIKSVKTLLPKGNQDPHGVAFVAITNAGAPSSVATWNVWVVRPNGEVIDLVRVLTRGQRPPAPDEWWMPPEDLIEVKASERSQRAGPSPAFCLSEPLTRRCWTSPVWSS
jgi:hypothetical protein